MTLLFYVSGHGFGHARRSARIVAALRRKSPELRVVVRTAAPAWIFTGVGIAAPDVQPTDLDAGVAEIDAMTVDPVATAQRVFTLLDRADDIVSAEVTAARRLNPSLVLADIPWLAADVAARLGVPCIGTGNFTWDVMYEPLLRDAPGGAAAVAAIRQSYRSMTAMLRQPFAHDMPWFPRVENVPLIARHSTMTRDEVSRRLGLDDADLRPRILIGMRGGSSDAVITNAARAAPQYLFTVLQPLPPAAPPNLRQLHAGDLDFTDLLVAHDAIISKLGYGIVADCIANHTPLLWPHRTGFAEDPLFEPDAPRWLTLREIPRADYLAGHWAPDLDALLAASPPTEHPRTDGEDVAADWLLRALHAPANSRFNQLACDPDPRAQP